MRVEIITIDGHRIVGEYRGTGVAIWPSSTGPRRVIYKNVGGQHIDTDIVDVIEYEYGA